MAHDSSAQGSCSSMCPHQEIIEREKKQRLHFLETVKGCNIKSPVADHSKCVKEYVRSAAGSEKTDPKLLRTPEALYKTTLYLLGSVLETATINSKSLLSTTSFISDRLRCVRQDIVIQQLSWKHAVPILERIIRYHIAVSKLLINKSSNDYDPVLNNVLLDSYMGDWYEYYDAAKLEDSQLENRYEFISYYILLNIQNSSIYYKEFIFKNYHNDYGIREELVVISALFECYHKKNYYRFFKLVEKLTFLQSCCLIKLYNIVRIIFLKQLNVAYSNKSLKFPLEKLKEWMLFSSTEDTIVFLNACGFSVHSNASFLYFDKNIIVKDLSAVELNELNCTLASKMIFQKNQLETKFLVRTINKK